jgi:hypothetical protein
MQRAGSRLVQRLLASGHTVVAFCYPPELGNAELMAVIQVGRQQAARGPGRTPSGVHTRRTCTQPPPLSPLAPPRRVCERRGGSD